MRVTVQASTTSICFTPPTARISPPTSRKPTLRCATSPVIATMPAFWKLRRCQARHRTARSASCSWTWRVRTVAWGLIGPTVRMTSGTQSGISSAHRASESCILPSAGLATTQVAEITHEYRRLAPPGRAHRAARQGAGVEVPPGRVRGRAREFHDRNCHLWLAGPHATLVIWRALHLSAHPAAHARQIGRAIQEYGVERVESVLDAALSLEQHVDVDQALRRPRYPELLAEKARNEEDDFAKRFATLGPDTQRPRTGGGLVKRSPIPPHPEKDLLWFIAHYAPELEPWERDIFLAVREESFYFYPVFATQIMNEGWASYWHARLLREADFIPQQAYLDAIKCHSDVVRPIAADQQVSLSVNPYHLGFSMWEKIIEKEGLDVTRTIMQQDDDFGFVRNHLTRELADELGMFRYNARSDGQVKVLEHDLTAL